MLFNSDRLLVKIKKYPSNPIFLSVYHECILTCQCFICINWNKIMFFFFNLLMQWITLMIFLIVNSLACLEKTQFGHGMLFFLYFTGFDLQIVSLGFLHLCSCLIRNCKCDPSYNLFQLFTAAKQGSPKYRRLKQ